MKAQTIQKETQDISTIFKGYDIFEQESKNNLTKHQLIEEVKSLQEKNFPIQVNFGNAILRCEVEITYDLQKEIIHTKLLSKNRESREVS